MREELDLGLSSVSLFLVIGRDDWSAVVFLLLVLDM